MCGNRCVLIYKRSWTTLIRFSTEPIEPQECSLMTFCSNIWSFKSTADLYFKVEQISPFHYKLRPCTTNAGLLRRVLRFLEDEVVLLSLPPLPCCMRLIKRFKDEEVESMEDIQVVADLTSAFRMWEEHLEQNLSEFEEVGRSSFYSSCDCC